MAQETGERAESGSLLVVLGSRAGIEAPTCLNVLLVYYIFLVYFGYGCVFDVVIVVVLFSNKEHII